MLSLVIDQKICLLKDSFTISRLTMFESYILVVEISDGLHVGRGECEPHESDPSCMNVVESIIEDLRSKIENGITRSELNALLPAGPARNAIDCALWDLEAKQSGKRAWELAEVDLHSPLVTAYTICLESAEKMAAPIRRILPRL